MISCSECKAGGRRKKGRTFRVMAFVFPANHYRDGAWLSWRWLNTCLPMGSSECIPSFALLACMAFALPVKLSLSQPISFL